LADDVTRLTEKAVSALAWRGERRFLESVFRSSRRVEAAIKILDEVSRCGGEVYVSTLLDDVSPAEGRLTREVVGVLVRVGLLRRVRDQADGRRIILALSSKAWRRQQRSADSLRLAWRLRRLGVTPPANPRVKMEGGV